MLTMTALTARFASSRMTMKAMTTTMVACANWMTGLKGRAAHAADEGEYASRVPCDEHLLRQRREKGLYVPRDGIVGGTESCRESGVVLVVVMHRDGVMPVLA